MYVEKINTYTDNPYADFGTEIHNAIEGFLNGKAFDINEINKKLDEVWEKGGYDTEEYIKSVQDDRASNGWKYTLFFPENGTIHEKAKKFPPSQPYFTLRTSYTFVPEHPVAVPLIFQ